uniref:helicase-related protein n=1 Tax=Anaerostipes sp. TaxID=1872530 RepID=UPI0039671FDE
LLTTKMNNIAGINTSSNSKRAFDMFMKCQYMEENCRNKGIVFLTGTPVSNSMAEVYTMQRYLQLNTLKELGIDSFDSWASTFGETKTAMELAPEGTGYRARTRFTRFVGLAELLTIFKEVADIKVKDIKEMDVPNAVMETISIDASDEQKKYVDGLASRAARIRDGGVDPSEDNMLKVTNEGRKLALDQRLVGIEEENFNSKAKYCVNQVMDIYEKYPGKTQVIFLDLSTPKKGEFNVYDDVKAKLIERGIPEGEIAFIHSAKTNKQKVDLCKKVNEGVIRVLLGSTDKAGTGCNFQKKLIALHDLDCPWRPSDLTQRSGRIIRQGNFNKEVYIYRYVTKNTFDSYLWQTVENKQRYIGQILSEENIPRRMEEDDLTLSFAEIKAAACGNPLIKEQMELTQQVKRLKMQKNNFLNQYYELESYISKIAPNRIEQYKKNIENIEKDIEVAKKYHTDDFHIKVLDKYDSDTRAEANKIIRNIQPSYKNERKIASYQGFDIILDRKSVYSHQTMIIRGNYDYEFEFSGSTNIMYQIDKIIEYGILEELKTFKRRLEFESRKFVTAKTELNPDFPHESELIKKQARLSELNQKLSA